MQEWPVELKWEIALYLDPSSFGALRRTSKSFCAALSDNECYYRARVKHLSSFEPLPAVATFRNYQELFHKIQRMLLLPNVQLGLAVKRAEHAAHHIRLVLQTPVLWRKIVQIGRYRLALMAALPDNEVGNAQQNTLYVSESGDYCVRDSEGVVQSGRFPAELGIGFQGIAGRLEDKALLKTLLTFMVIQGHAQRGNGLSTLLALVGQCPQSHEVLVRDPLLVEEFVAMPQDWFMAYLSLIREHSSVYEGLRQSPTMLLAFVSACQATEHGYLHLCDCLEKNYAPDQRGLDAVKASYGHSTEALVALLQQAQPKPWNFI